MTKPAVAFYRAAKAAWDREPHPPAKYMHLFRRDIGADPEDPILARTKEIEDWMVRGGATVDSSMRGYIRVQVWNDETERMKTDEIRERQLRAIDMVKSQFSPEVRD